MLNLNNVLETITMIEEENLDIRTITMGISLIDCIDGINTADKIYEKITTKAQDLVKTGEAIEKKYGIPIVNKRVSVTPMASILGASGQNPITLAKALDKAAKQVGIDFIGGFSALVHKGFSPGDEALIKSIPEALSETDYLCSSVNIGSTKSGINMDAVACMGEIIKETAERTADKSSIGAAKLVVFCNSVEDNPFMAGAMHGYGEADTVINVGVSGPGVVRSALSKMPKDMPIDKISEVIKKTAFKVTRMGELVGKEASEMLGVNFGILDLSLAPTPAVGDSVAYILEQMGLDRCGACGTTAALALLNDAVKKGGIMASSSVGGLSGAFIPVSEDAGMIAAAKEGSLTIEKLEAMTAVCSVGLDMIVVPGSTSAATLSGLIADEAAIGMINSKTTAVRIIPAIGYKEGDEVNFGGLLGKGPVMNISNVACETFINRGGRIPAPIQSLKN